MNIEVSGKEKVTDLQCISCFECTSERSCPVSDTVNLQTKNPSKELSDDSGNNKRIKEAYK
jgi:hypothetical protein